MPKSRNPGKTVIIERLPSIVLFYCIFQPLLDVAGYWQMQLELGNALTMMIRMVLLGGSVFLGFYLSNRKRYYLIMAGILAFLTVFHIISNLPDGYSEPVTDIINLIRIYLMPLTTIAFITFLRCDGERVFSAIKKGLLINFAIIVLVELLSVITKTDPQTYHYDHVGVLGWFFWANSQSAILSMLGPIVICSALKRWKDQVLPVALCTVAAEATLYFFGTRLTFGAMLSGGFGVSICLLIYDRTRWMMAMTIFLLTLAFTCASPLSPMVHRLQAVEQLNAQNEQRIVEQEIVIISESVMFPTESSEDTVEIQEPDHTPQNISISLENWEKLKSIYRGYMPGMVERFGYRRVIEKYNFTLDASVLGNWRIKRLSFCELLMEDASLGQHLFGINLQDMRVFLKNGIYNEETAQWEDGYEVYDVENDFHGVYFLLGMIGVVLMVIFLLWFGSAAILRVCKDFKNAFTLDMIAFAGSYVFGLLHAYFTVSVLRRNNASVYMAFILAGLWYLSQKQKQVKH